MTQAERRHDRLAVRLSLIISRLVAGETLSVRKLAAEFGVSVRTLRRDFRERLMYLDLEYQSGYLNQQNQLIAHETLFAGSISSTEVHPREVVKRALYFNAAAVLFAHNHPSGDTTPSQADKAVTQRLVQALQLVDIRVPDHLIVGGTQILSFAENGLL
ncbi:JAB domain-containing protein [Escherichia coli]|nr:DeoR family transcriptional regulator [Escherichia coli]